MGDLIHTAVQNYDSHQERKATGTCNGFDITLTKEYRQVDYKDYQWVLCVYINDEILAEEKSHYDDPDIVQEDFETLVGAYDLEEQ